MKTDMPKKSAVKTIIVKRLWSNSQWTVRYGRVNAGRGSTGAKRLFRIVGEKLPFEAVDAVEKYMKSKGMSRNGVYLAHDSMVCPRYIGRGTIFSRLVARQKAQELELKYFSFYVVEEKKHEREIETLLIRAAGPLLEFNTKKNGLRYAQAISLTMNPEPSSLSGATSEGRSQSARSRPLIEDNRAVNEGSIRQRGTKGETRAIISGWAYPAAAFRSRM